MALLSIVFAVASPAGVSTADIFSFNLEPAIETMGITSALVLLTILYVFACIAGAIAQLLISRALGYWVARYAPKWGVV